MSVASETGPSTEYDAFAPYYDAFTADSDYEAWALSVLRISGRAGIPGGTLLDLACGTGKSFAPFLARGFRVTGCDASAAMLAAAARRAPDADLVRADLRALPELGRFDLVTCFDDSLNYLLDEEELAAAFRGMAASLAPDGFVAFDLNTLLAYRTTFAGALVKECEGIVFAWRGSAATAAEPGCLVQARIDVFAPRPDGLYERTASRHRQRHFPRGRVVALLERAGLTCTGVHGVLADCSLAEPADEARHLKVLYTARPTRGGDPA